MLTVVRSWFLRRLLSFPPIGRGLELSVSFLQLAAQRVAVPIGARAGSGSGWAIPVVAGKARRRPHDGEADMGAAIGGSRGWGSPRPR